MSQSRPVGMGLSCIPQSEIRAWCLNYGVELNPWEVDTITAMDAKFVSVLSSAGKNVTPEAEA